MFPDNSTEYKRPSMPDADLLITNANFITLDPSMPRASAMAIKDGKILAIGSDNQLKHFSASAYLHLAKKTVTPGFIDSHIHLYWFGSQLLRQADLVGSTSIDDILARLSALKKRLPTGWLQGHG